MVSSIVLFPEVQQRIDTILDKFGNVKDTASDELYDIRRKLKDKEGAISKRIGILLKRHRPTESWTRTRQSSSETENADPSKHFQQEKDTGIRL